MNILKSYLKMSKESLKTASRIAVVGVFGVRGIEGERGGQ